MQAVWQQSERPCQTRLRLARVDSHCRSQVLDGHPAPNLSFFDVLNGRAGMRLNTAPGEDGCVHEVYQRLPFKLVHWIWELFMQRMEGVGPRPQSWDVIEYAGLPKTRQANLLDESRWISKLDCMLKSYMRSMVPFGP